MNKALKINIELIRERFKIKGFFNIVSLIFVILLIFIGSKIVLFKIGRYDKSILIVMLFITLLNLIDVAPVEISTEYKQISTFFPKIPHKDLARYYLYKKLYIFYVATFLLLFPVNISDINIFLFCMLFLSILTMINNIMSKINPKIYETSLKNIIRILFTLFTFFNGRLSEPINIKMISNKYNIFFLIILNLLFMLLNFKIIEINAFIIKHNQFNTRKLFIKDPVIMLIIRSDLFFDILVMFLLSVLSLQGNILDISLLSVTFLGSYIMIYYESLKNDKNKIQFFYNSCKLSKIRHDKIKGIINFSLVYLSIFLIIGIFTKNVTRILFEYISSILIFVTLALTIKINIEKKNDNTIITLKDIVILSSCSISTLLLVKYLIKF